MGLTFKRFVYVGRLRLGSQRLSLCQKSGRWRPSYRQSGYVLAAVGVGVVPLTLR